MSKPSIFLMNIKGNTGYFNKKHATSKFYLTPKRLHNLTNKIYQILDKYFN